MPAIFTWLGAIAVTPFVNVSVSLAASPKVTVPVLEKVAASVIVPPALNATLYPAATVLSVVAVKAPLNVIDPVVAVNVTIAALTVLENVVPADLEIVNVPSAVPDPTAPVTLIVPDVRPVSKVKFCAELFEIVPPKLILPFDVVVKVEAADNVAFPV